MLHIIIEHILGWNFPFHNQYFLNLASDCTYFGTEQVPPSVWQTCNFIKKDNLVWKKVLKRTRARKWQLLHANLTFSCNLYSWLSKNDTFLCPKVIGKTEKMAIQNYRRLKIQTTNALFFSNSELGPSLQCTLNTTQIMGTRVVHSPEWKLDLVTQI